MSVSTITILFHLHLITLYILIKAVNMYVSWFVEITLWKSAAARRGVQLVPWCTLIKVRVCRSAQHVQAVLTWSLRRAIAATDAPDQQRAGSPWIMHNINRVPWHFDVALLLLLPVLPVLPELQAERDYVRIRSEQWCWCWFLPILASCMRHAAQYTLRCSNP